VVGSAPLRPSLRPLRGGPLGWRGRFKPLGVTAQATQQNRCLHSIELAQLLEHPSQEEGHFYRNVFVKMTDNPFILALGTDGDY